MSKSLTLLALLLLAACASQPAPTKAAEARKPNCMTETGTHIPPKDGKCIPASGRVHTREDLDRSGAQSTGEALRKLGTR